MGENVNKKGNSNKKRMQTNETKKDNKNKENLVRSNVNIEKNNIRQNKGERVAKKEKKKKSKVGKFFARFFLLLLIAAIVVGCVFAYKVNKNGGGLEGLAATILGTDKEVVKNLPPIYVVLLGESENLTDTIILASYYPSEQKASLLSIPRDTFVGNSPDNASPWDKINALCQYEYPERTTAAVAKITGVPVTNYVLVNTGGLKDLVDLVGPVWFDVPIDMKYTDRRQNLYIKLKAGYQEIDGNRAEQLLRFRHNSDRTTYPEEYGIEDIGRQKTQRNFLKALAKQTLKPQNVFKIGQLLDLAYKNVKTNMTMTDFKDYIPSIVNFDSDNLKTDSLPGTPKYLNDYAFFVVDEKKTKKVVEKLFLNQTEPDETSIDGNTIGTSAPAESLVGEGIKVEILNGTDNDNALTNLKNKLAQNGYNVVKTGTTKKTKQTTIINNSNKENKIWNTLKTVVGIGELNKEEESSSKADFTIIIGADY